ncbi:6-hydroxymethylpterin diphosphokinase MptE-like protein [Lysinibacillus irui]|uniref:motility associated factor glycosyltransferase family protein n=1 Tax=Lysinibacillus irui TaxID=2998077 RepID=UPI003D2932F2
MKFEKQKSKNGEDTLRVNGLFVYSKYQPLKEAEKFIQKEINLNAESYLLVGLGLGYHLLALVKLIGSQKRVFVLCIDKAEMDIYTESIVFDLINNHENIKIVTEVSDLTLNINTQVLIPHVWLQLMDKIHPLFEHLNDIKIKQMSFKRFGDLMRVNFSNNSKLRDFTLEEYKSNINISEKKFACLVSSGPSLGETKEWLHSLNKKVYILCVGSALKVLINEGIEPDAVIITDAQEQISEQLKDITYKGQLFYLSTANYDTVKSYKYNRCILLQHGYEASELLAKSINYPLLDTGGSVATTAFSLLEYFGFEKLVMFGQDLGFVGGFTHAAGSTSGRKFNPLEDTIEIISNEDNKIFTLPNLYSYLKWFEMKINSTHMQVYNTAAQGAKIIGAYAINKDEFLDLIIDGEK